MFGELVHVALFDIEGGYEDAFDDWYQGEHLPALMSRPGWSGATRYECTDGQPSHLVIHSIAEDALDEVHVAAPFRDGTFARRIRNYTAEPYEQIFAMGDSPDDADLINLVTVDIDHEQEEAFNTWYDEVHVPEIVDCPGWIGNRRYRSLTTGGRVMAAYGLEDEEEPFGTDQYEASSGWDDFTPHIRGYHGFRIYRLVSRVEP
jgi:hypothetical protein